MPLMHTNDPALQKPLQVQMRHMGSQDQWAACGVEGRHHVHHDKSHRQRQRSYIRKPMTNRL